MGLLEVGAAICAMWSLALPSFFQGSHPLLTSRCVACLLPGFSPCIYAHIYAGVYCMYVCIHLSHDVVMVQYVDFLLLAVNITLNTSPMAL